MTVDEETRREAHRREALEYHRANPMDVTSFATSRIGLGMALPNGERRLYRLQAEFLETLFPAPRDLDDPITNPALDEGVALWGKGSGKDTIAVIAEVYAAYRLLLHDDARRWLRTPVGDTVDLVNVAYNAPQARTVFFERMTSRVLRSPFFRIVPRFQPERDVGADFVRFPNQILAHSLHAQSAAAEGKNTLIGVMDEADAFKDKSMVANAEEMLETLSSSIKTRYTHTRVGAQGLVIILSWPRHAESFTIREFARSRPTLSGGEPNPTYTSRVHGSRATTYQVRPELTPEHFADDYAKDAEGARAKYEVTPPLTEDAFFSLTQKVDAAFRGDNIVRWEPTTKTRTVKGREFVFSGITLVDVEPRQRESFWIHCDAGLKKDSYALAMSRADGDQRIVEALIEWEPRPGVPVDFLNVRETILDLAANYQLQGVSFDQWNSAETIQEMQSHNLHAEEHTFTNPYTLRIYQNLKAMAYGDRLILPREGPSVAKLRRELTRLQLVRGAKVDHPLGESKDIADAVADAVFMVRAYEDAPSVRQAPNEQPTLLRDVGAGGFNSELTKRPW